MKPRFPLSVSKEWHYRARIDESGEILYCSTFKSLYRVTMSHMRAEVREIDEYTYCPMMAHLEYGYEVNYEIKPGYFYSEWYPVSDLGYMFCSKHYDTYTRNDNTDLVIERSH